jgi:hypothetical protein
MDPAIGCVAAADGEGAEADAGADGGLSAVLDWSRPQAAVNRPVATAMTGRMRREESVFMGSPVSWKDVNAPSKTRLRHQPDDRPFG